MPSDFALRTMNSVHRLLVGLTRGRVGHEFGGMPVVELTTTGRKSGQPRTVLLTAPLRDGEGYVVVASRGGDDRHPAWFLNLREHPEVEVAIKGGERRPMLARIASAEERARMWPQIAGRYRNYASYQKRTEREIPLVVLEERG
ncbi:nitroreductase family deazaflavin-dependent oxidoreductase [Pseudonocardia humida]|uniref:Nitroreductase family deazaflavin-dependent oxidoreductase n=1 Tax=Pseudonocardia humida TaxID=2800819 RepID=A0ABT0ZZX7_9PSEU|nr:nitroreductase family deazaflavin-dependent oxidoreductase [Pseudonocardia humida]MCO1656302.1 nitroreductase family deazaflavin-dependent oxidoreductase [Pseudonocardia humida]